MVNSFVDFFDFYGSFVGEDLDDIDFIFGDEEFVVDEGEGEGLEDGE